MRTFRPSLDALEDRLLASATPAAPSPPLAATTAHVAQPLAAGTGSALTGELESARAAAGLPALAGGLIAPGRGLAVGAVGLRQQGEAAPVGADDQFHLGSNGKAMTATLAAVLAERGAIRWNSTLAQVFPELARRMSPAYRGVTLEQLLNHRGGIADPDEALFARIQTFQGPPSAGRAIFLAPLLKQPPANPAGQYSYSNTGYAVAAAMLERVTGRSYESLMQRLVFRPLGMSSAGFGPPGRGDAGLTQPVGHDENGQPVGTGPAADAPAVLNPAGLIHMGLADWSKFLRVHLGEAVNGHRLLSRASLEKLHTPDPRATDLPGGRYGFGWMTIQTPLGPALWHNGSNGFWYSEALLFPSRHAAAFAVTNQGGAAAQGAVAGLMANLMGRLA